MSDEFTPTSDHTVSPLNGATLTGSLFPLPTRIEVARKRVAEAEGALVDADVALFNCGVIPSSRSGGSSSGGKTNVADVLLQEQANALHALCAAREILAYETEASALPVWDNRVLECKNLAAKEQKQPAWPAAAILCTITICLSALAIVTILTVQGVL